MSKSLAALRAAAQMALAEHGEGHHITRALNETIGRIEREQSEQQWAEQAKARAGQGEIPKPPPPRGFEKKHGVLPGMTIPKPPPVVAKPAAPKKFSRDVESVTKFLRGRGVVVT